MRVFTLSLAELGQSDRDASGDAA